jgi:hypothetical protein
MVLSLASLLSEREGVTLYIEYKVEKKRSKNQKPKTPPQTRQHFSYYPTPFAFCMQ